MDTNLASALNVEVPQDLVAKLQLSHEMESDAAKARVFPRYAIAASIVIAMFVGGLMLTRQATLYERIGNDYEKLLSGVVEHMNEQPITPVWEVERANNTVSTLLASYDTTLRLKELPNLNFGRICPMGEYRGLHATLETEDGQITFAFIKGAPLGDVLDASYEGFITRVKPVIGGNLIIISRNQKSLDSADTQLKDAMYWDI
jgi:hypothetical protein